MQHGLNRRLVGSRDLLADGKLLLTQRGKIGAVHRLYERLKSLGRGEDFALPDRKHLGVQRKRPVYHKSARTERPAVYVLGLGFCEDDVVLGRFPQREAL